MAYDQPQADITDGQQQDAPDDDSARIDDLEARVSAIEAKLGMSQPSQQDDLGSQIQQSSPFGK